MTMNEKRLRRLAETLEVPVPDPAARQRAFDTAVAEFERAARESSSARQGTTRGTRLTRAAHRVWALLTGGTPMKRSHAIAGGLAVATIAVAAVLTRMYLLTGQLDTANIEAGARRVVEWATTDVAPEQRERLPAFDTRRIEPSARYEAATMASPSAPMSLTKPASPASEVYQDVGRDRFDGATPNPVKVAAEEPVSTFSVDVDTASYAFARRELNRGVLPQKAAVRIEELVNYFDYDYPLPDSRDTPFRATVVVYPTPWNPATRLVQIGIQGYALAPAQRPRANLVFLIDVSGSMNAPDKLPLLENALRLLVEGLQPQDSVAIVTYAGRAGTVLEPTAGTDKHKILRAIEQLGAGGSTAGGEGIRQAYALARAQYDSAAVNRVILATDGDFNVGITDQGELKGFVERERASGISLSVLGFGQGNYNDALMQALAQNGNGNAAYIDTLNEARKVLVEEAGGTLFTIAKDVKIQVEFNPARVAEYRLLGYETRLLRREDFSNDQVDAGEIGAGHRVTALYEITPAGSPARRVDDLRYGVPSPAPGQSDELGFLKIRYKLPAESESRLVTLPITDDLAVASAKDAPNAVGFAAAVAGFGQLLRGDPYLQQFGYDAVLALGEATRGPDRFGYRSEFLNLVRLAKSAPALPQSGVGEPPGAGPLGGGCGSACHRRSGCQHERQDPRYERCG
jgi:Ca-activated chloride channel family protein